ncbi:SGNH/GDSL hydrolase family protein [Lutibacter holmesii]|uniref:SGNH/GDSL hydrolase family protein n=1 Tax=Lutibacter holmesii TaxID=1137985 RepID=A0ABW3WK19_9FLAO
MSFTYREEKGSPLTSSEIDANFKEVENLSLATQKPTEYETLAFAMAVDPLPVDYTPFTIRAGGAEDGYYIYLASETNGYKSTGDFETPGLNTSTLNPTGTTLAETGKTVADYVASKRGGAIAAGDERDVSGDKINTEFDIVNADLDKLKTLTPDNNIDHTLNNINNVISGSTIVSNKVYTQEVTISSIYAKTGTLTSTDISCYIYVVDASNVITQDLGIVNISSAVSDTQYEIYSGSITLPIGHKVGLVLGDNFSMRYNATTDSGGFIFQYTNDPNKDKNKGESIFSSTTQDFTLAISLGWDATSLDINKDAIGNNLYGSVLCGIGDSMMAGHTLNADEVYAYKIAERNGMTFTNAGINGNFLTDNGGSGTPLVNRVTDIPLDTEILIVDIGTNDANSLVTIGSENSTDITEFYGALNSFLEDAVNRIPSARIIFISPYLRNVNYQNYVDALKIGCGKYGIPVFDNITEGLIKWDNTAQYELFTLQDGYHFNAVGHLRSSYKYESFMKSKF